MSIPGLAFLVMFYLSLTKGPLRDFVFSRLLKEIHVFLVFVCEACVGDIAMFLCF